MNPRQTLLIIWSALLSSTLFYAGIGYALGPKGPPPESAVLMVQVLGLFALLNVGVSYIIRPMLATSVPFQTYMIIRWSMCESAAVFGLVLRMLGASLMVMAGFVASGLIALLIAPPNASEEAVYEALRRKA